MTALTFLAVAALAAAALAATEAVLLGPNAPGATHSDIRSGRGAPGVPRKCGRCGLPKKGHVCKAVTPDGGAQCNTVEF